MERLRPAPAIPLLGLAVWLVGGVALLAALETPSGSVTATVVSRETGRAIPEARLVLRPLPPLDGEPRNLRSDANGQIALDRLPAGDYEVSGSATIHTLASARLAVREGERLTVTLEMEPRDPFFELNVHQNIFALTEPVQVVAHGYVRSNDLELTVFRMPIERGLPPRLPWGDAFPWGDQPRQGPAGQEWYTLESERSEKLPITEKDAEGVFTQRLTVSGLPAGLYVGEVTTEGIQQRFWFVVTEIALIAKRWPGGVFASVSDFRTGGPRAGVPLVFYSNGRRVNEQRTDANGMFRSDTLRLPNETTIVARDGDSLAFTEVSFWSESEQPGNALAAHFYTDRPIFRPGDTVHYKAIFRTRTPDDAYQVPDAKAVSVEIRDPRDTLMQNTTLQTNAFGSIEGSLTLPGAAMPGEYGVTLRLGAGKAYDSFAVAAYRKPEFTAVVQAGQPRYVAGDVIRAPLTATYYFGAPVANAEVEYTVTRTDIWGGFEDEGEWQGYGDEWEGDYGGYGEPVFTGHVTTDAAGRAVLTVPTEKTTTGESDSHYQINAFVTDTSDRSVSGQTTVLVTRGEFNVLLSLDRYAAWPNEKVPVLLRVQDYDKQPKAGVALRLELERQEWDGRSNREVNEIVARPTATTDAQGRAQVDITPPRAGYYRIRATATDTRGNHIGASQWLWVTTETYADLGFRYPSLEVIADRKEYAPGDTARLVINCANPGTVALLAIEGDRLYEARRLVLKGKTTVVEVPLTSEYIPNVFANVRLLGAGKDENATVRLPVSPKEKTLTIAVTPDKKEYLPGDTATVAVQVTDAAGQPAQAEVSVGVVDEAIYAIREEPPPDIVAAFYPVRTPEVRTVTSYPRVYLDAGDKGGEQEVALRRRFEDTAFWRAVVVTDATGRATVSFPMPDNLTTWRVTAVGQTRATLVGSARADSRTTKPLLVRLITPRFSTAGDRFTVATIVHNDTAAEKRVEVRLTAQGATLADATPQTVTVKAGGAERLDWAVDTAAVGTATFQATAREPGGLNDGIELKMPVQSRGFQYAEHRSGPLTGTITETFLGNTRADPDTQALEVRLAPSLLTMFIGSLESLAQFPWGCIEQIMSGLMPDLAVQRLLAEQSSASPWLQERLPEMVRDGLAKIYARQNNNGSWGWGRYDDGDPWMTAYVVLGLVEARDLGYEINPHVLESAVRTLREFLAGNRFESGASGETRALIVFALAKANLPAGPASDEEDAAKSTRDFIAAWVNDAFKRRHDLPPTVRALLTLTLDALGRTNDVRAMAPLLWDGLTETRTFANWDASGYYRDAETTAWGLRAAVVAAPDDPRIAKVVNWFVVQRAGGMWFSTRATSLALLALADYVRHTGELRPDLTIQVRVNGALVKNIHFGPTDIGQPEPVFSISAGQLDPARSVVEITATGAGRAYYNLTWSQMVGGGSREVLITGAGLTVRREYRPLRPRVDPETGRTRLEPAAPATRFSVGDFVSVRLIIEARESFDFLLLEDLLPAGFEVTERGDLPTWEWSDWWADVTYRDDRVGFYLTHLAAGTHELSYLVRVETPGVLQARAPEAWAMYDPAVRARGRRTELTVQP